MRSSSASFRFHRQNEWRKGIDQEILDHISEEILLTEKTFMDNSHAKYYIASLSVKRIPCKVINLGAGVKKIIIEDQVCPHCGGKRVVK